MYCIINNSLEVVSLEGIKLVFATKEQAENYSMFQLFNCSFSLVECSHYVTCEFFIDEYDLTKQEFNFISAPTEQMTMLINNVESYQKQLIKDFEFGGTVEGIDIENGLFLVLEKTFNWNIDSKENTNAMQYVCRATDFETCEYLLNYIIPSLKTKTEYKLN